MYAIVDLCTLHTDIYTSSNIIVVLIKLICIVVCSIGGPAALKPRIYMLGAPIDITISARMGPAGAKIESNYYWIFVMYLGRVCKQSILSPRRLLAVFWHVVQWQPWTLPLLRYLSVPIIMTLWGLFRTCFPCACSPIGGLKQIGIGNELGAVDVCIWHWTSDPSFQFESTPHMYVGNTVTAKEILHLVLFSLAPHSTFTAPPCI